LHDELSDKDVNLSTARRRYLKSAERKQQIRDAALVEFSSHGYAATTMHRIADRVGMSKTGIYAHYTSKEAVFEDLLMTVLSLPPKATIELPGNREPCLQEIVENYVEHLYSMMENPRTQDVFQLLMAEHRRVPKIVRRWYHNVVEAQLDREQKIINECVARGIVRKSALTDQFILSVSPFLHASLQQLLFKEDPPMTLALMRNAHKQLLLEILRPC
jgi:AcrR family transcriptional regulator